MSQLYFRHGVVGSAKTMNLLAVAHNYEQQNKKVLIMKPKIDIRFGCDIVKSRCGLERRADIVIDGPDTINTADYTDVSCILVDEAQFLSMVEVDTLRQVTAKRIPVICYGLRTDFQTRLFPGSERLLAVSDKIEEIKTTCVKCNKKAIFNLRHRDGVKVVDGPQIELGTEDMYSPVCYIHYGFA